MKSRVHPKYKTQYRVGNWAEYDRALVRRGDVTLWLTPDAIATWAAAGVGSEVFTIENESKSGETTKTYVIARHFLEMAAAQNWPLDGTPGTESGERA